MAIRRDRLKSQAPRTQPIQPEPPPEEQPEQELPPPIRTSVVIVTRNHSEALRTCLAALGTASQVIVIDNGSSDDTPAIQTDFPDVRYIRLPRDFGRTKALNIGVRASDGEFVLFLDEAVEITPEAIAGLANVLQERAEVGASCPVLVDEDGAPAPQIRALPSPSEPDPPFHSFDPTSEEVPCVSGSALMTRNYFLKALRQIDEHYGDYGAAAELCAQFRRANRKIVVVESARAVLHSFEEEATTQDAADRDIGTAVFLGKYYGSAAGWKFRLTQLLKAMATLRLGKAKLLIAGQKIDGNQ